MLFIYESVYMLSLEALPSRLEIGMRDYRPASSWGSTACP
jgi:hypothetical protein